MHVREFIHLSWWQRVRRSFGRIATTLRLRLWFPQIPLALAVAGLGTLSVLESLPKLTALIPELQVITPGANLAHVPVISGLGAIPELVIGVVLLIMALGLLFRSRLSWALTLIIAGISLVLLLRQYGFTLSAMSLFNGLILVALLFSRRHFSRSSVAAGTLFAFLSIILLMTYAVLGSYVLGDGFAPKIHNLITALYFAVVTMSTVGYGDIVPKSPDARLFVISIIILGITVFATSISAVVVPLVNGRMQRLLLGEKKATRQDHYVLVGDNTFAQNTYRALRKRHLRTLVVLTKMPESAWVHDDDLFVGDATDPDLLRRAGVAKALGVLALRIDDSENAFIVLAAKEIDPDVKTVALVNSQHHMRRLRQTGADLIIAPEVLGGQLLVRSLLGEELPDEDVLSLIFGSDEPAAESLADAAPAS